VRALGRIGATERPPCDTEVRDEEEGSGRPLTVPFSNLLALDGPVEADEEGTPRAGDAKLDMADPGRAGRFGTFLAAIEAFFCASIVSLNEGLGGAFVLFEKPMPGRTEAASAFLGVLGLAGSCCSLFC